MRRKIVGVTEYLEEKKERGRDAMEACKGEWKRIDEEEGDGSDG